ncbi:uncharacterized protein LOC110855428 [Folsomia candida]|uniref:Uncharacterized protein n=1 Tax=Folsomia candida TaxID=158441 RepID=A0A226DSF9_FOLCA|nr:uncharacterized protein LOC110855428 [Folsomia candida]OXA48153.1 hypothetical protein Fcan01_17331 [Folsomia candida]
MSGQPPQPLDRTSQARYQELQDENQQINESLRYHKDAIRKLKIRRENLKSQLDLLTSGWTEEEKLRQLLYIWVAKVKVRDWGHRPALLHRSVDRLSLDRPSVELWLVEWSSVLPLGI